MKYLGILCEIRLIYAGGVHFGFLRDLFTTDYD